MPTKPNQKSKMMEFENTYGTLTTYREAFDLGRLAVKWKECQDVFTSDLVKMSDRAPSARHIQ